MPVGVYRRKRPRGITIRPNQCVHQRRDILPARDLPHDMTHDMLGDIRLGSGGHFDGEVGEIVVAVSQTASTISQ